MALTRSENMARIRASNTQPELILRRGLWASGLRYRLQVKTPGGKADLVISAKRFALFIDGCFWHGCPEHYVRPGSRNEFWDSKLRENIDRDRRQTLELEAAGWLVLRVWEHAVRENPEALVETVLATLEAKQAPKQPEWRVVEVRWANLATRLERRVSESLRDPGATLVEERVRSTRKVGRVGTRTRTRTRL